ncbi:hypothetical protein GUITHDRAFT_145508 [Guillardia theta CCMP2712]|uniref:Phosphoglycerate mutase n=1 Tax=Guillardia theta (strain CCMP2712) TaxID=905079 RepID=L1IKY1_GUITC|nr:hypothetical protein GUITHDRAFT_145508 [Guillardia theta CCMP2712]EKX36767.1 hypothetical protein GUITHDRAFT_145508 [Guillardia theta CCMP2712]|eukprot:XP_005823747.1 hypothetical protein GUITHDRAFT_145508 [Guillardia theta CCMP2712]
MAASMARAWLACAVILVELQCGASFCSVPLEHSVKSGKPQRGEGMKLPALRSCLAPATILLVRHGQTEWNVQGRYQGHMDSPLTARGRQEAQLLGKSLPKRLKESNKMIDNVFSSDLERARDTAKIISAEIGIDTIHTDTKLRERGFGIFEGLTREEVKSRYPEEMSTFAKMDLDYKVAQNHPGKVSLVVTHGAVISLLMRWMLGIPFSPQSQAHADFKIRNSCLCELRYVGTKWEVLSFGDVAHCELDHILKLKSPLTPCTPVDRFTFALAFLSGGACEKPWDVADKPRKVRSGVKVTW